MPRVEFEPTISAGERPKTYALDRTATGTREKIYYLSLFLLALGLSIYQQVSYPIISQNSVNFSKTAINMNYVYRASLYRTIITPCLDNNKTAFGLFLCSITQSSTHSRDTNLQQFQQTPSIIKYFPHVWQFLLINLIFIYIKLTEPGCMNTLYFGS